MQLAVAFDYLFAVPTLLFGLKYALSLGAALPVGAVVLSGLAFACLFAAWWWDSPLQYLVLHGLWHMASAAGVCTWPYHQKQWFDPLMSSLMQKIPCPLTAVPLACSAIAAVPLIVLNGSAPWGSWGIDW